MEDDASRLRAEALEDLLDDWEAEQGPLTAAELAAAARELGLGEGVAARRPT